MSKRELSQSDKELAEELAHGIYIGDSPIWIVILLLFLFFFTLIPIYLGILNLFPVLISIFISMPVGFYYSYHQTNKRSSYIEKLVLLGIKNNIEPNEIKQLKGFLRLITINNLENLYTDKNIDFEKLKINNNAKIILSAIVYYGILSVLVVITLESFSYLNPNENEVSSISREEMLTKIKENAIHNIDYRDLMRNIENYEGKPMKFHGKIIQVQSHRNNRYTFRIATREGSFSFNEDVIWASFQGERFLEDDIVEGYAVIKRLRTYNAIFGNQITIPEVEIVEMTLIR